MVELNPGEAEDPSSPQKTSPLSKVSSLGFMAPYRPLCEPCCEDDVDCGMTPDQCWLSQQTQGPGCSFEMGFQW